MLFMVLMVLENRRFWMQSQYYFRGSYGKSAEQILRNNMGLQTTQPESVTKELNEIYHLIDIKRLDDAKRKIEKMRLSIGNDPDLVRSSALIKRKEITGK
jgi:hypothetical protein